jgi:hypothetical protein
MKARIIPWKDVKAGDRFLYKTGMATMIRKEPDDPWLLVYFRLSGEKERHMQVHPDDLVAVRE